MRMSTSKWTSNVYSALGRSSSGVPLLSLHVPNYNPQNQLLCAHLYFFVSFFYFSLRAAANSACRFGIWFVLTVSTTRIVAELDVGRNTPIMDLFPHLWW